MTTAAAGLRLFFRLQICSQRTKRQCMFSLLIMTPPSSTKSQSRETSPCLSPPFGASNVLACMVYSTSHIGETVCPPFAVWPPPPHHFLLSSGIIREEQCYVQSYMKIRRMDIGCHQKTNESFLARGERKDLSTLARDITLHRRAHSFSPGFASQ